MADPSPWDLILEELRKLNDKYETLANKVSDIRTEMASMKVKSGLLGVVAGMIPVAIVLAFKFI